MAQTETQAAAPETTGDATENQETTQEATPETSEQTTATAEETTATAETTEVAAAAPEEPEEISYHAVEKEGHVAAIWEMQGRRHLRTIDPRSGEGKNILSLFTSDHHEEEAAA
jgi:hypothetical protein